MNDVIYERITEKNFSLTSLDGFVRRQAVEECWRRVEGEWKLPPVAYVEDWDLDGRRLRAEKLLRSVRAGDLAYGAWTDGRLAGFARLAGPLFGSGNQYVDLAQFHVSLPCRGRGIGKELFRMACQGARELGASWLYISAHSAKESMAAYRALGCVEAEEINWTLAKKEPCDVQLEYRL